MFSNELIAMASVVTCGLLNGIRQIT